MGATNHYRTPNFPKIFGSSFSTQEMVLNESKTKMYYCIPIYIEMCFSIESTEKIKYGLAV